ncbi:hypothetical protein [Bacterioplanes sanyensis]|uniref:hypothetical protein n=1 Tax=Bacterioplanes sanyensis TaxID=1249553 RepID=UPI00167BCB82|nr:hypothetical protein [Bacterioplanes sanyensis]
MANRRKPLVLIISWGQSLSSDPVSAVSAKSHDLLRLSLTLGGQLKTSIEAVSAGRKVSGGALDKRSLLAVSEHFFEFFNAAETTQIAFSLLCAAQAVIPELPMLWSPQCSKAVVP